MPVLDVVDLSKYQGQPDFAKVKAAGISVVAVQASFGSGGKEPDFLYDWQQAKVYGLGRVAYHYAYPAGPNNIDDARQQAQSFWSVVSAAGFGGTDLLALDLEEVGGSVEWATAFLNEIRNLTGTLPGFYSYLNYIQTTLGGGVGLGGESWLWLADVGVSSPPCPAGWPEITLWQYAQSQLDGIVGTVDDDTIVHPLPVPAPPAPQPAPVDLAGLAYINLLYQSLLFRPADPAALAAWVTYYEQQGALQTLEDFLAKPEVAAKQTKCRSLLASDE